MADPEVENLKRVIDGLKERQAELEGIQRGLWSHLNGETQNDNDHWLSVARVGAELEAANTRYRQLTEDFNAVCAANETIRREADADKERLTQAMSTEVERSQLEIQEYRAELSRLAAEAVSITGLHNGLATREAALESREQAVSRREETVDNITREMVEVKASIQTSEQARSAQIYDQEEVILDREASEKKSLGAGPMQWIHFAWLLRSLKMTILLLHEEYDAKKCFSRAVEIDAANPITWKCLGWGIGPTEVTVDAWSGAESAEVRRTPYGRYGCMKKALELDPTSPYLWANVSIFMPRGETFSFENRNYTRLKCLKKAVEMKPSCSYLWGVLGPIVPLDGVMISNGLYSNEDCFLEALRLNPRNFTVWDNLGNLKPRGRRVFVDGRWYTLQQCCEKAIEINPQYAPAWNNLGDLVEVDDPARGRQCQLNALEIDPEYAPAWYNIGANIPTNGHVTVAGRRYSEKECYEKVLEIDPYHAPAWANLGAEINHGRHTISGVDYTQEECFLKSLDIDPECGEVWSNLGNGVEPGRSVLVSNTPYTKVECLVKSVELQDSNADSWYNLANALLNPTTATCIVNGVSYTAQKCYVKALLHNPHCAMTWTKLGGTVRTGTQVRVSNRDYSQQQCIMKALEYMGISQE